MVMYILLDAYSYLAQLNVHFAITMYHGGSIALCHVLRSRRADFFHILLLALVLERQRIGGF